MGHVLASYRGYSVLTCWRIIPDETSPDGFRSLNQELIATGIPYGTCILTLQVSIDNTRKDTPCIVQAVIYSQPTSVSRQVTYQVDDGSANLEV